MAELVDEPLALLERASERVLARRRGPIGGQCGATSNGRPRASSWCRGRAGTNASGSVAVARFRRTRLTVHTAGP
jgi:hypothetical protein